MSTTEPPAAGRARTPGHVRVVFGLGALGLTIQWFDRLDRVLAGGAAGWSLAWDVAAVGLLPLGAGYFAYRAVSRGDRDARPGAAPNPDRDVGAGSS